MRSMASPSSQSGAGARAFGTPSSAIVAGASKPIVGAFGERSTSKGPAIRHTSPPARQTRPSTVSAKGTACSIASSGRPAVSAAARTATSRPAGVAMPAAESTRPAITVSAKGTGAAVPPAIDIIANPSAMERPAPPSLSGTSASVSPFSSSARHRPAGSAA